MRFYSLFCPTAVSLVFPVLCLFFGGLSQAGSLELKILENRVVIQAEGVDLKEILQAVSLKTGMRVSYFASATSELISCRIDEPTMAISLSSLLKNWNYSLVFVENREGPLVPEYLWLFSKVSDKPHSTSGAAMSAAVGQPDDHVQHLQKNVFATLFKEDQVQARQTEVNKAEDPSGQAGDTSMDLLPGRTGIQITALVPDSSYEKIGLHAGDKIYDVNGTPVNSVKDLVSAMKASGNKSIIRIERYTADQVINPIYIELH